MSSVGKRLKALFGGGKSPEIEADLKALGISVIADKKFAERQEEIQAIFDLMEKDIDAEDPEDYVEKIKEKLDAVNRGIISLAAPYYRSLDNTRYGILMEGWSIWARLASSWVQTIQNRILTVKEEMTETGNNGAKSNPTEETDVEEEKAKETKMDKGLLKTALINMWILVKRLEAVLDYHVFQDAQLILMRSYGGGDVGHGIAVTVQTLSRGGFSPADYGRQDYPPRRDE